MQERKIREYKPEISYGEDLKFWKEQYYYFKKLEDKYLVPLMEFEDAAIERFEIKVHRDFVTDRICGYMNISTAHDIDHRIKGLYLWLGSGRRIYDFRWFKRGMERNLIRLALVLVPQDVHDRWHEFALNHRYDYSGLVDEILAYDFSEEIASLDKLINPDVKKLDLSQIKPTKGMLPYWPEPCFTYDVHRCRGLHVVPEGGDWSKLFWHGDVVVTKVRGFLNGYTDIMAETAGEWGRDVLSMKAKGLVDSAIPVRQMENDFIDKLKQENERLGLGVDIPSDLTGMEFYRTPKYILKLRGIQKHDGKISMTAVFNDKITFNLMLEAETYEILDCSIENQWMTHWAKSLIEHKYNGQEELVGYSW